MFEPLAIELPIFAPLIPFKVFVIPFTIGVVAAERPLDIMFKALSSLFPTLIPALVIIEPPKIPPVRPLKTNSEAIIPAVKAVPCRKSSAQKEAVPKLSPNPISCSS